MKKFIHKKLVSQSIVRDLVQGNNIPFHSLYKL